MKDLSELIKDVEENRDIFEEILKNKDYFRDIIMYGDDILTVNNIMNKLNVSKATAQAHMRNIGASKIPSADGKMIQNGALVVLKSEAILYFMRNKENN